MREILKNNRFNGEFLTINNKMEVLNNSQVTDTKNVEKNRILYPYFTKEWASSIYSYNKSYIKPLVSLDFILNKLIKSYINMSKDNVKILFKRRRDNKIRYSANRTYSSTAELNHTNKIIFITLYLYNKKKLSFERSLRKLMALIRFKKRIINRKTIFRLNHKNRLFHSLKNNFFISRRWNMLTFKNVTNVVTHLFTYIRNNSFTSYNIPSHNIRLLKKSSKLQETLLENTESIDFELSKFNTTNLESDDLGVDSLTEKLYGKEVQMNVTDLKKIDSNSDIFSSAVALKLRDRKNKAVRILRKAILQMVKIPDLHTLITFDDNIKAINKNNIINTIKQQIVSGVRFEAAGRLTRRLTAMRAVFKYRYAGSLKNIRSSFNGKSSTMLRGHVKSTLQYTLINSKTRNGTFGLKGWVSSHGFNRFYFWMNFPLLAANKAKLAKKAKLAEKSKVS